jgi:hypothetical protein
MNGSSAVNFNTIEKRNMLANLKEMINSNIVAPDLERHPSLVLALRPAQATDLYWIRKQLNQMTCWMLLV